MLAHFIPHNGKGLFVPAIPLICGCVLFILFDGLNWDDRFILPISLLLSSFIIWFYDGGPAVIREGIREAPKSKNTLFWIEIKYWAIVLGIAGCVFLGHLF
ncbi:hypothetical protein [Mucilaginibacter flavidus]|uniref:hypothetical protein n=1 Tax=Mucilaginibacter flavidus TaxID=2949309 RepID=UPI0020920EEB|nr:hypothetical protein [Mucilaginibacter flavidus]MCO5946635.1 hypothetical protein [Mucilaginibacter flavidus]